MSSYIDFDVHKISIQTTDNILETMIFQDRIWEKKLNEY